MAKSIGTDGTEAGMALATKRRRPCGTQLKGNRRGPERLTLRHCLHPSCQSPWQSVLQEKNLGHQHPVVAMGLHLFLVEPKIHHSSGEQSLLRGWQQHRKLDQCFIV